MKHSIRQYLIVFALLFCTYLTKSQDVRFSQYEYTPQFTNPAAIASDNYLAAYIDYRSQRISSDLVLNTMSILGKYPLHNQDGKRIGAVGLGFISDRSEGLSEINSYGITGSIAHNLYLNSKWALSSGVGFQYARDEVTLGNFTTGSQWVTNRGFIPDMSTGESFDELSNSYLSLNGGLRIYKEDELGDVIHYLGLSIFHFNKPDISYMENGLKKPIRYSIQAGASIYRNRKIAISPELIIECMAAQGFIGIGVNFTYFIKDEKPFDPIKEGSLNFKIRNIVNESIVLGIQFNQPNFSLGFSHDVALTPDKTQPMYNASEFTFTIKKRIIRKPPKKKIVSNYSVSEIKKFYKSELNQTSHTNLAPANPDSTATSLNDPIQFELKREFSFGFNENHLDQEDKHYLDDLSNLLKLNPELKLEITGHADDIGSEHANKKISTQRAHEVEKYLHSQGIERKRMKYKGVGSDDPLVPNTNDINRAKNRRVEFSIYKH